MPCSSSKYGVPSILTPFSVYVTLPIEPYAVIPDGDWSPKLFNHVSVLFLFLSKYNTSEFSIKFFILFVFPYALAIT